MKDFLNNTIVNNEWFRPQKILYKNLTESKRSVGASHPDTALIPPADLSNRGINDGG
jgi:hypothetical protein